MLPLLLAAAPAGAEDPATNTIPIALTVTAPAAVTHLESSSKLERTPEATEAKPKKHWWTRLKSFFKSGPSGEPDETMQYEGLSSRPWAAISADPPYMSNWQNCRVHHPSFGVGGSY